MSDNNLLLNLEVGSCYKTKQNFIVFKLRHSENETVNNWETRRNERLNEVRTIFIDDIVVYLGCLKIPADNQDIQNIDPTNKFWEIKNEKTVVLYRFLYGNFVFYNHEYNFYWATKNVSKHFNKHKIETTFFEKIA